MRLLQLVSVAVLVMTYTLQAEINAAEDVPAAVLERLEDLYKSHDACWLALDSCKADNEAVLTKKYKSEIPKLRLNVFRISEDGEESLLQSVSSNANAPGWNCKFDATDSNKCLIRLNDRKGSEYKIQLLANSETIIAESDVITGKSFLNPISLHADEYSFRLTLKPTETPKKFVTTAAWYEKAWDVTAGVAITAYNSAKEFRDDAISYWKEDRETFDNLCAGSYMNWEDELGKQKAIGSLRLELIEIMSSADDVNAYLSSSDAKWIVQARKLMKEGDLRASIIAYQRWLQDIIENAIELPPLCLIEEAIIAPAALIQYDYASAFAEFNDTGLELGGLVLPMQLSGIKTRLKTNTTRHPSSFLSEFFEEVLNALTERTLSVQKLRNVFQGGLSDVWVCLAPAVWVTIGEHSESQKISAAFLDAVTDAEFAGEGNAYFFASKCYGMMLEIQDMKNVWEKTKSLGETIENMNLVKPAAAAKLNKYIRKSEQFIKACNDLMLVYRVDIPVQLKILVISAKLDQTRGYLNDDEAAIINIGSKLEDVSALLPHHSDSSTTALFVNIWARLKDELSDEEFEQMKTKAKISRKWLDDVLSQVN